MIYCLKFNLQILLKSYKVIVFLKVSLMLKLLLMKTYFSENAFLLLG